MTNNGLVLGNWGADQRNFGDGVGARSQMLRIGWEPPFGGYLRGAGAHAREPELLRRRLAAIPTGSTLPPIPTITTMISR